MNRRTPSTALVANRPAYDLARRIEPGGDNPVTVYMKRLGRGSRPAILSALNAIAEMAAPSFPWRTSKDDPPIAYQYPWAVMRYQMTAAIRAWLAENYAPRSANRMICALRGVLKEAWGLEQMSTDDYHRAIKIKTVPTHRLAPAGRVLELEEIEELYRHCAERADFVGARDAALITLLYAGGLRREEASSLDMGHWDKRAGALTVKGKGDKYRTAYIRKLHQPGLEEWFSHRAEAAPADPMLLRVTTRGALGNRLTKRGVSHAITELAKNAKVKPFTPHDLRRSFGTHLMDKGADILMVQQLMGHASLQTTAIYDRRGEKGKAAAIEFLPEINFPRRKP